MLSRLSQARRATTLSFAVRPAVGRNVPVVRYIPPRVHSQRPRYFADVSAPVAQPSCVLNMPALSPTMETGKVVKWIKKVGDKIQPGDALADIETDKATIAFESTDEGFLAKILVNDGDVLPVGKPIALVVDDKSQIPQFANFTADMLTGSAPAPATPAAATPTPTPAAVPVASPAAPVAQNTSATSDRVIASPFAQTTAKEKGVDIKSVAGTGPGGRIIAADVLDFAASAKKETVVPVSSAPPAGAFTEIPTTNIRKIIAQRLSESKQQIPHYYLTCHCNVDKLLELRATLNALAKEGEYKLSVTDFVTKAAALALKQVPAVNSEWRGDHIRQYNVVHINMAVNTDNGLLTPVIRDCDKIGLKSISSTLKEVAKRAQAGKSTLDDLAMGTFTISNLGMYDVNNFNAVINPPQAGILAVGNIEKKVVEVDGTFQSQSFLTVTLSADHRVVDGAIGAQWLQHFKGLIENPIKFLL